MRSSISLAKVWFAASLAILSFGYGFASHAWDLFPKSYVQRAWRQALTLYGLDATTRQLAIPRVYDRHGVRRVQPQKTQPGLVLITSSWTWGKATNLEPGAKLIDRRGRTLHEWHPDKGVLFPDSLGKTRRDLARTDFDGSYLLPNGDLILILGYIGAVRLDACGNVRWRLQEGNHHYFSRSEDGSFWMPGTSSTPQRKTSQHPDGFEGIEKPVWMDQVLHVGEDGTVIDRVNVLDLLYENDLKRHIVKGYGPYAKDVNRDPVHLNDVEPLGASMAEEYPLFEAGDLLLSLRHPSLVLVFDPDSGRVRWHNSRPLLHQHDPDFTGEGWIGVFDNNDDFTERGTMLGGSRIVALQPHTDSTRIRFPTRHSAPFYTSVQGQWQNLENGNLLLTESRAGRVVEVTPDGRTAWEWIHEPYSSSQVPVVTGASYHDLTRNRVRSWSCSPTE